MPSTRKVHPDDGSRGRFATTQWSLVLAAGQRGSEDAEAALARLCTLYWYPIFAFIRRQGYATEDAQDLAQGFFARLIEKNAFEIADRSRGRFRSFLLTACQHFLSNERNRAATLKRGGGQIAIPVDVASAEERYQRALSNLETPERLYDRQWCLTLLAAVLDDLREEFATDGNDRLFDRLRGFLTIDDDTGTHEDAARDLGMTAAAVKVAVHRLRRRYRDALRNRIADTVDSPQDVDDELHYLFEALSRPNRGA